MSDVERIPNSTFGANVADSDTNLPGQDTPQLEYYQTPAGNLRIEEAQGPTGAWVEIEIEIEGGRGNGGGL